MTKKSDIRRAFTALQDAHRELHITETLHEGRTAHRVTADDLILDEGSATYGRAWGVFYSPWHNGARWDGASAHYTPRGLGGISTDAADTLIYLRAYTAGLYALASARKRNR